MQEFKIFNTHAVTSLPTICQNFLKKIGDIPSGSGDFDGAIWKMACLTLRAVYGCSKSSFMLASTTVRKCSVPLAMVSGWGRLEA
ncbi:UNVERIFIED_CONTAM: hypothetical protein Slati_4488200 [Sesamum latifolium]|uniref:Uncharacterized protein n=1 Tax=Sesamum latifolium TaxID=2727402 RepID=A0AAW2SSU8_9LAMI